MKRLTDPTFQYVPSGNTDIRKTFARVRREMKKAAQPPAKVSPIARAKKVGS